MKLDRLETHDRYLQFQKQWEKISEGCLECIKNVPEAITSPFYVFAHGRTVDEMEKVQLLYDQFGNPSFNVPSMRLIWTPRITKPKSQPNSYLFLAQKNTDVVKIIWLLPKSELWHMFEPEKMTYSEDVWNSIQNYKHHRRKLDAEDPDGPTENDIQRFRLVYGAIARRKSDNI